MHALEYHSKGALNMAPPKPNKATSTSVDTIEITPHLIKTWKRPGFQREIRVNAKVEALAEEMKASAGGSDIAVLPGIITIGVHEGSYYKLDGQHRLEAFGIAGLTRAYADVRYFHGDMADMADEFVRLNSHLVNLKPDDILRGLEGHCEGLQIVRSRAKFVGYGNIRRNASAPLMSMSVLLRCWAASAKETPSASAGASAMQIAKALTDDDAKQVAEFINIAERAWGRDPEYSRLYGALNMTLAMWFYRRVVLAPEGRVTHLNGEMFRILLVALSADARYLDHLVGRQLNDRERSPCYGRMKTIFVRRFKAAGEKKPQFPQPPWAHHLPSGSSRVSTP